MSQTNVGDELNPMTAGTGRVYVGIGGWTFEPWRGVFYPEKLPQKEELAYASRKLTSIEINGTFYRTQTPATFRKWASETPADFVFSVKAPRYATQRGDLTTADESIRRFIDSGVLELGGRLGPLLWQLAPTKKFSEGEIGGFLELLPEQQEGRALRHVLEVRHASFCTPGFVDLLRRFNVATVYTDHATYPAIADVTADFVYLRLQNGKDTEPTAYPSPELDRWAQRLRELAAGTVPTDLPKLSTESPPTRKPLDVYAYVIHEGKIRAPAAAMAVIKRLSTPP
jgi:uncharacterized protein YecE (DUF72 family)